MTCIDTNSYNSTNGLIVEYNKTNSSFKIPLGCNVEKLYLASGVLKLFEKVSTITQKDLDQQNWNLLKARTAVVITGVAAVTAGAVASLVTGAVVADAAMYYVFTSVTAGDLIVGFFTASGFKAGMYAYNAQEYIYEYFNYNPEISHQKKIYEMLTNPKKHYTLTTEESMIIQERVGNLFVSGEMIKVERPDISKIK